MPLINIVIFHPSWLTTLVQCFCIFPVAMALSCMHIITTHVQANAQLLLVCADPKREPACNQADVLLLLADVDTKRQPQNL